MGRISPVGIVKKPEKITFPCSASQTCILGSCSEQPVMEIDTLILRNATRILVADRFLWRTIKSKFTQLPNGNTVVRPAVSTSQSPACPLHVVPSVVLELMCWCWKV